MEEGEKVDQEQEVPKQEVQQQQQQQQPRDRRTDHWHFEKRLSFDTVIAIIGVSTLLGGPLFYWGRAMEQRVQTLELREENKTKVDNNREQDMRDQRITLLNEVNSMKEQITLLRIDVGTLLTVSNGTKTSKH